MKFPADFSWRALFLGLGGAAVIAASSTYVALRLGALPWPTIFVAVVSMACLRPFGASLREINVAHTGMSAGGLVAGGVAFTLPGLWMADPEATLSAAQALGAASTGALLGAFFTAVVRRSFIEEQQLPYPMGAAAAETLLAGDSGGRKARVLFGSLGFSGVITALRDGFGVVPALVGNPATLGFWLSPMALGIGYIIGPLFMGSWLAGGVLAHGLFLPLGFRFGLFSSEEAALLMKNSLGIGLIVGAGVATLLRGMVRLGRRGRGLSLSGWKWSALTVAGGCALLTAVMGLSLPLSLLVVFGVWLCVIMAATLTGQTGIDPMEVFGILLVLFVRWFFPLGRGEAYLLAAVVAVATGLAGDALQDFKAGHVLGTNPFSQWLNEVGGGMVGAFVAVGALFIMKDAYGAMGPGTQLVAPQAFAVKSVVEGLFHGGFFLGGAITGMLLALLGIPAMTLGIGVYLPLFISTTAGIGGGVRLLVDKTGKRTDGNETLIASGFLGGEGLVGVLIALLKVVTGG